MASRTHREKGRDRDPRRAFRQALDAIEDWRYDLVEVTEQHSEKVFDRMTAAGEAIGLPDAVIENSRRQLVQATRTQTDLIDGLADAWRDYLDGRVSELEAFRNGSATLHTLQSGRDAMLAPAQLWLEATAAWQENWANAMRVWTSDQQRGKRDDRAEPR